jgi:hypothetical protein
MSFKFEAAHAPGQSVTIRALERPGHVTLVRVDEGGRVDYHVVWWDEGKRCGEWLDPREIGVSNDDK